ncbi:MAG: hypothetical protein ABIC68_00285, partial [Candidatus Omnitrophota bacterium]
MLPEQVAWAIDYDWRGLVAGRMSPSVSAAAVAQDGSVLAKDEASEKILADTVKEALSQLINKTATDIKFSEQVTVHRNQPLALTQDKVDELYAWMADSRHNLVTCGALSLAGLSKLMGRQVSPFQVAHYALLIDILSDSLDIYTYNKDKKLESSLYALSKTAMLLGIELKPFYIPKFDLDNKEIAKHLNKLIPFIAFLDDDHMVLVKGLSKEGLIIEDNGIEKIIDKREVYQRFSGYGLMRAGADYFGLDVEFLEEDVAKAIRGATRKVYEHWDFSSAFPKQKKSDVALSVGMLALSFFAGGYGAAGSGWSASAATSSFASTLMVSQISTAATNVAAREFKWGAGESQVFGAFVGGMAGGMGGLDSSTSGCWKPADQGGGAFSNYLSNHSTLGGMVTGGVSGAMQGTFQVWADKYLLKNDDPYARVILGAAASTAGSIAAQKVLSFAGFNVKYQLSEENKNDYTKGIGGKDSAAYNKATNTYMVHASDYDPNTSGVMGKIFGETSLAFRDAQIQKSFLSDIIGGAITEMAIANHWFGRDTAVYMNGMGSAVGDFFAGQHLNLNTDDSIKEAIMKGAGGVLMNALGGNYKKDEDGVARNKWGLTPTEMATVNYFGTEILLAAEKSCLNFGPKHGDQLNADGKKFMDTSNMKSWYDVWRIDFNFSVSPKDGAQNGFFSLLLNGEYKPEKGVYEGGIGGFSRSLSSFGQTLDPNQRTFTDDWNRLKTTLDLSGNSSFYSNVQKALEKNRKGNKEELDTFQELVSYPGGLEQFSRPFDEAAVNYVTTALNSAAASNAAGVLEHGYSLTFGNRNLAILQAGIVNENQLLTRTPEERQKLFEQIKDDDWAKIDWENKPLGAPGTLSGWALGLFTKDEPAGSSIDSDALSAAVAKIAGGQSNIKKSPAPNVEDEAPMINVVQRAVMNWSAKGMGESGTATGFVKNWTWGGANTPSLPARIVNFVMGKKGDEAYGGLIWQSMNNKSVLQALLFDNEHSRSSMSFSPINRYSEWSLPDGSIMLETSHMGEGKEVYEKFLKELSRFSMKPDKYLIRDYTDQKEGNFDLVNIRFGETSNASSDSDSVYSVNPLTAVQERHYGGVLDQVAYNQSSTTMTVYGDDLLNKMSLSRITSPGAFVAPPTDGPLSNLAFNLGENSLEPKEPSLTLSSPSTEKPQTQLSFTSLGNVKDFASLVKPQKSEKQESNIFVDENGAMGVIVPSSLFDGDGALQSGAKSVKQLAQGKPFMNYLPAATVTRVTTQDKIKTTTSMGLDIETEEIGLNRDVANRIDYIKTSAMGTGKEQIVLPVNIDGNGISRGNDGAIHINNAVVKTIGVLGLNAQEALSPEALQQIEKDQDGFIVSPELFNKKVELSKVQYLDKRLSQVASYQYQADGSKAAMRQEFYRAAPNPEVMGGNLTRVVLDELRVTDYADKSVASYKGLDGDYLKFDQNGALNTGEVTRFLSNGVVMEAKVADGQQFYMKTFTPGAIIVNQNPSKLSLNFEGLSQEAQSSVLSNLMIKMGKGEISSGDETESKNTLKLSVSGDKKPMFSYIPSQTVTNIEGPYRSLTTTSVGLDIATEEISYSSRGEKLDLVDRITVSQMGSASRRITEATSPDGITMIKQEDGSRKIEMNNAVVVEVGRLDASGVQIPEGEEKLVALRQQFSPQMVLKSDTVLSAVEIRDGVVNSTTEFSYSPQGEVTETKEATYGFVAVPEEIPGSIFKANHGLPTEIKAKDYTNQQIATMTGINGGFIRDDSYILKMSKMSGEFVMGQRVVNGGIKQIDLPGNKFFKLVDQSKSWSMGEKIQDEDGRIWKIAKDGFAPYSGDNFKGANGQVMSYRNGYPFGDDIKKNQQVIWGAYKTDPDFQRSMMMFGIGDFTSALPPQKLNDGVYGPATQAMFAFHDNKIGVMLDQVADLLGKGALAPDARRAMARQALEMGDAAILGNGSILVRQISGFYAMDNNMDELYERIGDQFYQFGQSAAAMGMGSPSVESAKMQFLSPNEIAVQLQNAFKMRKADAAERGLTLPVIQDKIQQKQKELMGLEERLGTLAEPNDPSCFINSLAHSEQKTPSNERKLLAKKNEICQELAQLCATEYLLTLPANENLSDPLALLETRKQDLTKQRETADPQGVVLIDAQIQGLNDLASSAPGLGLQKVETGLKNLMAAAATVEQLGSEENFDKSGKPRDAAQAEYMQARIDFNKERQNLLNELEILINNPVTASHQNVVAYATDLYGKIQETSEMPEHDVPLAYSTLPSHLKHPVRHYTELGWDKTGQVVGYAFKTVLWNSVGGVIAGSIASLKDEGGSKEKWEGMASRLLSQSIATDLPIRYDEAKLEKVRSEIKTKAGQLGKIEAALASSANMSPFMQGTLNAEYVALNMEMERLQKSESVLTQSVAEKKQDREAVYHLGVQKACKTQELRIAEERTYIAQQTDKLQRITQALSIPENMSHQSYGALMAEFTQTSITIEKSKKNLIVLEKEVAGNIAKIQEKWGEFGGYQFGSGLTLLKEEGMAKMASGGSVSDGALAYALGSIGLLAKTAIEVYLAGNLVGLNVGPATLGWVAVGTSATDELVRYKTGHYMSPDQRTLAAIPYLLPVAGAEIASAAQG